MIQEHKTLELSSIMENVHQVEALIEEVCEDFNLNNTYLGCITVAVTEAFENAVKHGNNNDPSKKVILNFQKSSTGLSFSIKDEGKGFEYQAIPNAKSKEKGLHFPGRGVFLIQSLADDVKYVGNGNELEIGFKISSINFETAVDRIKKLKQYSDTVQKVEK